MTTPLNLSSTQISLNQARSRARDAEAASIQTALPEGFNVDAHDEKPHLPDKEKKFLHGPPLAHTILNIVNGAIWGVLARKGLMVLTTYSGSFLGGVIWANFAACVVMGMFVDSSKLWNRLLDSPSNQKPLFSAKGAIPLYAGVTTGFCGSCSSFSTFILETFNKAADTLPHKYHYPNGAYGIMEALAVVLAHVTISVGGFYAGRHLIAFIESYTPPLPPRLYRLMDRFSCILGVAAYIVIIVLIPTVPRGSWRLWTFLVLFAPWGALVRFYLSKYLNPVAKNFPLGTFTANIAGCLLLAVFTLIARGRRPNNHSITINTSVIGCHVLTGLDDGFCGALTTVSTFVVELVGLATGASYIYGFMSIVLGFIIMILILGSFNWAVGLLDPVC